VDARMELLAKPVNHRAGKMLLTLEVIVKGRLRDPGFLQDAVQTYQMDAVPVK
jgi:hypothetical protein